MKIILTLLVVLIFSGVSHADCLPKAEVANRFINEYKIYCDDQYSPKTKKTALQWILRNKKITDNFKSTYKQMILGANKEDPEMGSGFDPIFDAQYYPDRGFKILKCNDKSNFVTLKGIDMDDFKVVVKVIKTRKGWLVDGAGVINIPEDKQAVRD